ncbi:MAG: ribokinase, partial [Chloroflexi bacterium]|nr:ribokinase [Chloroflexota bacterium]
MTTAPTSLLPYVPRLAGLSVLVIGDVFLDEYLIGRAERLSREAPVPVLEYEEQRLLPGGGANPAANIASLGSHPVQVGVVGDDTEGVALRLELEGLGIDPAGLVQDPGRPTSTKMRVVARSGLRFPQQLARLDRVDRRPLSQKIERKVTEAIRRLVPGVNAVLISDYRSGLCTRAVVEAAREAAGEHKLVLTADSQGSLDLYREFALVKCNHAEAEAYLGRRLTDNRAYQIASQELMDRLALAAMLVTRGERGLTLASRSTGVQHIPASNVSDVFDTTGAGDTVIAVATL